MPISVEQNDTRCLILLEGGIGVAEASELKRLVLAALSSRCKLLLDLDRVELIDLSFMQLLQAALREARLAGKGLAGRVSAAAEIALRCSGFGPFTEVAGWGD